MIYGHINPGRDSCGADKDDKTETPKHGHYFKRCPYPQIDVYRVLELFQVTDPCLQHAAKKLLVAGGRGHKDIQTDVEDAIDSLLRWREMRREDSIQVGGGE